MIYQWLRHYKIVVIFDSIINRVSNQRPYESHHHTVRTTPPNCYNLRRGEIRQGKNKVIKRIVASIVSIFSVFEKTVGRIRKVFISLELSAPQGKSSHKNFSSLVSTVSISQGTNKHTNSLASYCFRGQIGDQCRLPIVFIKLSVDFRVNWLIFVI